MSSQAAFNSAARQALGLVAEHNVIGLGTGHAATAFIHAVGDAVQQGLHVRGVPTSKESAELAASLSIPLVSLDEVDAIDIDVDGADEVDPDCNLIKGYGGALVREKVVASVSRQLVILVGPEKLVPVLGTRGMLPIEVVPFALSTCLHHLRKLGISAEPRRDGESIHLTDNGNPILDCQIGALSDPQQTEQDLLRIPGVVGTGLFLNMADVVIIASDEGLEIRYGH